MENPGSPPASAIILAGGKGTRLKRDKPTLIINGKPILNLILAGLERVDFREVILAYGTEPKNFHLPVRKVSDLIPGAGVLGGILTGLTYSQTDFNFVTACDMPFPQPDLVKHLLLLASTEKYDCLIPVVDGYRHPLFAVYRKTCIPVIRKQLEQGNLRIASIFPSLQTREVPDSEFDRLDPRRLSFFNINTPDDLRKAEELSRNLETSVSY